jgi:hypothetical protein
MIPAAVTEKKAWIDKEFHLPNESRKNTSIHHEGGKAMY